MNITFDWNTWLAVNKQTIHNDWHSNYEGKAWFRDIDLQNKGNTSQIANAKRKLSYIQLSANCVECGNKATMYKWVTAVQTYVFIKEGNMLTGQTREVIKTPIPYPQDNFNVVAVCKDCNRTLNHKIRNEVWFEGNIKDAALQLQEDYPTMPNTIICKLLKVSHSSLYKHIGSVGRTAKEATTQITVDTTLLKIALQGENVTINDILRQYNPKHELVVQPATVPVITKPVADVLQGYTTIDKGVYIKNDTMLYYRYDVVSNELIEDKYLNKDGNPFIGEYEL